MKISFLLPNDGIGGGVRAIVRFGNELISMGHHVRIFHKNINNGISRKLRRIYYVTRYGFQKNWLDDFQGFSCSYNKLEPAKFVEDEIILSMCAQTTLDAYSLPEQVGIKVLHCHGAEIENWDYMVKSWQLPMPKIVVSSYLIDLIKKETGQDALGVAPDGVDTKEYYPCIINSRDAIGGCVRWSSSKDPETTIEIFRKLYKDIQSVQLISFGSDRKPPLNFVQFKRSPTITQAREIYSRCKVWFLASKAEGFGLPILEAMACGCVVVSTDSGGPRDIISDGVNGFLVKIGDVEGAVKKIKILYANDSLREEMSTQAIETAKKFTWSAGAAKLESYLKDIYKNNTLCIRQE